eukprot:TRINITY_DN6840_c0_g1_i1.p1 TRINITY_DN6840_c0_g1~~TRINITY_DN6840_c0_g1_i1.p1  ORF type:complete len:243 (+),score=40.71 TRINITY_DN6840_c0_g1_i1:68-730(+)
MELESISNCLGWVGVMVFWLGNSMAMHNMWKPPVTRPSGMVTVLFVMADVSNLSGTVLGEAPRWQMAVAMLFIIQDMVHAYGIIVLPASVTEFTTVSLKRACGVIATIAFFFLFGTVVRQVSSRELAIEMGIISALSNISARLWRFPKPSPPLAHHYLCILGQVFYSAAIISHPDGQKDGQSYLEENAPWLIGSLVPALLEYNVASEMSVRHKKDRHTLV